MADAEADDPKAPPAAPLPPGTKLADEGGTFSVPRLTMVRYGAGDQWTTKHVDAHVVCTCGNDYFEGDPAPHKKKACFVADPPEPPDVEPLPPGMKLADEGGTFTVPTTTVVKYGADTRWTSKQIQANTETACTTETFGSDPAQFTKKSCIVSEDQTEPPVPPDGGGGAPENYKELAYDYLGPKGIAYRFGSPATTTDAPTLPEKAVEGYTEMDNDPNTRVYYSFGPPNYNDPNYYMTVNATVIGAPMTVLRIRNIRISANSPVVERRASKAVQTRDAVAWIQNASVGSEAAASLPQMLWQTYSHDLTPSDVKWYIEQGMLSNTDPADFPVCTYRGESGADSPNTRMSLVATQGSATRPARMFTSGTFTASNEAMCTFELGLVPTSIGISNNGEFALVTMWDTNNLKGKIAIVSLGEGPDGWEWDSGEARYRWWDTWLDNMHPGHGGSGNFCFMKVIGYMDLPAEMTAPTDIKITTGIDPLAAVMYEPNGTITSYMYMLSPMKDNLPRLRQGGDAYEKYAKGGVAIVCSRSERKVCFIDLTPLWTYTLGMYFGSAESNAKTLQMGFEPDKWPYMLADHPEAMPKVVKTVAVDDEPVTCWVSPFYSHWSSQEQGKHPKAGVITKGGKFIMWSLGRYAPGKKPTTPEPGDIREIGRTSGLGTNITHMCICKGHPKVQDSYNNAVVYVDRAARSICMLTWTTGSGGNVTFANHTWLKDSRMDPVVCALVDNYHTMWNTVTVADPTHKCVHNYRFGELKYGGDAPQWSPAAVPTTPPPGGEYQGRIILNCAPYGLYCSNVP